MIYHLCMLWNVFQLPVETEQYTLAAVDGPSIVIVLSGTATADNRSLDGQALELKRGSVVFISANESLQLTIESRHSALIMYRAFCTSDIWSVILGWSIMLTKPMDQWIFNHCVEFVGSLSFFVLCFVVFDWYLHFLTFCCTPLHYISNFVSFLTSQEREP